MDYVVEIENFKNSFLYKKYYERFVGFLKMSGHSFKSKEIETVMALSGSDIRKLAQHARRSGVLICSGSYGYKYVASRKDAVNTVNHLKQRIRSLQSTVDAMENSNHYKNLTKGN